MADYRVRDGYENVHHVSVPQAELDVKDGRVDLSGVDAELRLAVEAELALIPALERSEAGAPDNKAAEKAAAPDKSGEGDK